MSRIERGDQFDGESRGDSEKSARADLVKRLINERNTVRDRFESRIAFSDKAVITLAGVGFGATIANFKWFVEQGTNWHEVLFAAWTCWGLATIALLLSYRFGISALRGEITSYTVKVKSLLQVDDHSKSIGDDPKKEKRAIKEEVKTHKSWSGKCRDAGGWLLMLGIVLMLIFGIRNASSLSIRAEPKSTPAPASTSSLLPVINEIHPGKGLPGGEKVDSNVDESKTLLDPKVDDLIPITEGEGSAGPLIKQGN